MARFGIDATSVSTEGKGEARTQRKAVEALAGGGHEIVAFVACEEARELLTAGGAECVLVRARPALAWEQLGIPSAFARHRLDAFLTTTERPPARGPRRVVVWFFELPVHRIEQNRLHGAGLYQRASDLVTRSLWKRGLRHTARILTGSRATADELVRVLPEVAGRVRIAYPGLDEQFAPGPGADGGPYVFHLGSSDPRDNTETAVAAFALARARIAAPVRLVVAGGLGERRAAIEREAERLELGAALELRGRVSDEELRDLYRGAAAYLDASLFEGFGYQVLEAMACGAPVVASKATSIPEIVGEAGLLCDPTSAEELADALARVLADDALADDLRRRGLERAAEFRWERTAGALSEALEEAAGAA